MGRWENIRAKRCVMTDEAVTERQRTRMTRSLLTSSCLLIVKLVFEPRFDTSAVHAGEWISTWCFSLWRGTGTKVRVLTMYEVLGN